MGEASSWQRLTVTASGSWAFARSLLACTDVTWVLRRHQAVAFLGLLAMFAGASTLLVFQPLNYRWMGFGVELYWLTPLERRWYLIPAAFGVLTSVALLPALLLATAADWSVRRRTAAIVLTLIVIAIANGWIAPAGRLARDHGIGALPRDELRMDKLRVYGTTADVMAAFWSQDRERSQAAWGALRDLADLVRRALAFALLGIALGAWARHRATIAGAVTAWAVAWVAYDAARHWDVYFMILVSLPRTFALWVADTLFIVTALLLLALSRRNATRPFIEMSNQGITS